MNDPYATPESDVQVGDDREPPLYIVSRRKLLTLGILTVSLYFVYWHYRNWQLTKIRNDESLWPIPRAIFSIFFTHSLFTEINELIKTRRIEYQWNPMAMATIIVVVTIAANVFDRLAGRSLGSPTTDFISIGLTLLLAFLYVSPQKAINIACGDPDGSSNARFTVANWAWILLGLVFWALVLLGVYAEVAAPHLLVE